jgi:phosphopantetheinyl transferase
MTACSATAAARRVAGSVRSSTQRVRHHPALPAWLSRSERRRAAAIRDTAARNAWLSARDVAKRLVAAGLPGWPADPPEGRLATIEIRSRDRLGRGIRPQVWVDGRRADCSLSLAHTVERVFVAVRAGDRPLGVDLTPLIAFDRPAACWWLSAAERRDAATLGPTAAEHVARIWSVKEAVYKALLSAEPFAPRMIEVRLRRGLPVQCTAAGRDVPVAAIRLARYAGHVLALVLDTNEDREAAAGMVPGPVPTAGMLARGVAG